VISINHCAYIDALYRLFKNPAQLTLKLSPKPKNKPKTSPEPPTVRPTLLFVPKKQHKKQLDLKVYPNF
jgi:hypothetical protein